MNWWQQLILGGWGAGTVAALYEGYRQTVLRKNVFGLARKYAFLGIFVWGDAIVVGIFWLLSVGFVYSVQDWPLFLLIVSLFWVVRSQGEVIYWINQQFSPIRRNPPKSLLGHQLFPGDSIWFVYQVIWQCVTVISLLATVYLIRQG